MNLDPTTLLYVCTAVAALAAAVMSLFAATQGTHAGFGLWLAAQWLLVVGLALHAVFGAGLFGGAAVGALLVQWPIVVLAGMRRLQMRKRPAVPPPADWCVLAVALALLGAAWGRDVGPARSIAAFALAAGATNVYAAVLVSRLGGFSHSFGLKALAATAAATALVEATCAVLASSADSEPRLAWIRLGAELVLVVSALGLVPIALALTFERTVAKMRATHRKLRHLADIDVLTRLPNRRHFHELATRTLATSEAASTALLMFDIENLKRINDLLGPSTGDEALRQVGLTLRETLRARDVAGRLGGDEFAAMLPDTTVADAVRVAARISKRLEDRQVAPRTVHLTLNVGAVQMRAGDTIIEALRRADIALDDARGHRHGRPPSKQSLDDTVTLEPDGNLGAEPA